jgi:acyl-CoA thioesterase-2
MTEPTSDPLRGLLRLFDLRELDADRFAGDTGPGEGRLFGGLVAAQATLAACRTVSEAALHSLHAYFLRPGRHGEPIEFSVHRIHDGRSFHTRRVVAEQAGEAIFTMGASFAQPEEGIAHQEVAMPDAPPPEESLGWEEMRRRMLGAAAAPRTEALDVRVCDPDDPEGRPQPPRRRIWLRPRGVLPEDPRVHAALLVYASDRALLSTAARPHGLRWGERTGASLDHAFWLHRPVRFDGWLLYSMESPVAHAARGLIHGAMYSRDGARVASVAQEALIRALRPR